MSHELAGHPLLGRIAESIGPALVEAETIFTEELTSRDPYVRDVVNHVTRFRGKRLRPILLLLTAEACGGIQPAHKVLAAVVEMIHTATLVHDDVLDEAQTRRHVATVNARWNNSTSVLCGDFLFTHAFHLAASLDSGLACRLIGRATNRVCEGELTQIHHRGNVDLEESEYLSVIDGKTAELCALCSYLGAYFADQTEAVCEQLEQFGRSLGLAFQIADDLLDLTGSSDKTGKAIGADFLQQTLTLPVIRLRDQSTPDDQATIRELCGRPTEEGLVRLVAMLEQSDALEYARDRAERYARQAAASLRGLPETPARRLMEELTEFVCRRAS